jgi:hypothetical protein
MYRLTRQPQKTERRRGRSFSPACMGIALQGRTFEQEPGGLVPWGPQAAKLMQALQ